MRRCLSSLSRRSAALLLASMLAPSAAAQLCANATDHFWKNDNLPQVPPGTPVGISIIQGLCENEAAASVFTMPQTMGPQQITKVAVGFGHTGGGLGFSAAVNVEIYDGITWNGNTPVLGPKVFDLEQVAQANAQVQSTAINEVDLTPYNVVVGNDPSHAFVVAFRMRINPNGNCATGYPANFFTDNSSFGFPCDALPKINLIDILGQGWVDASVATVQGVPLCPFYYDGNWVIRACSQDAGPPPVCQQDLGLQGPGSVTLEICGGDLTPGTCADLRVTQAAPGALLHFFGSTQFNPVFLFDTFGVLGPNPPTYLAGLPADGAGTLFLPCAVPGGTGTAFSYYLQAIATDPAQIKGYAHSNCVRIDFK